MYHLCQLLKKAGEIHKYTNVEIQKIQSGRSGLAKHGGANFLAVYGFVKDPISAPDRLRTKIVRN